MLMDERHRIDHPPDGVTVLPRTTALGVYHDGYVVAHERTPTLERLWHVRAARVVLATGAHERFVAFAGNDRPGVMLASAAAAYVERFGVLPGDRAAIFNERRGRRVRPGQSADALRASGADIAHTLGDGERRTVSARENDVDLTPRIRRVEPEPRPWRAVCGWRAPL